MKRPLNEREQEVIELAAGLADAFSVHAAHHDLTAEFPHENYRQMKAAGFLRLTVPREFGGFGASLYELMLALERLAMGDAATALAVNMHLTPIGQWAGIWRLTRHPALEDILVRAGRDELVWAGFTSEPRSDTAGNVIMASNTTATRVEGGFIVDGYKIFCTNIEVATDFTITAQLETDHGPELLLLKTRRAAEGLISRPNWEVAGMRATQSGDLEIKGLFVPEENLIHRQPVGHYNEMIARTILCWGVSSFGAVYGGIGAGAIEWARQQIVSRKRQADPVLRHLFAEMEVLLETGRAVTYRHAHEVADGRLFEQLSVQEVMARSALAKMVPVNHTLQIMNKVIDAVGAPTFMLKNPFQRMWRDAQAGPIMPFNNIAAHKLFAATLFEEELAPTSPCEALEAARGRKRRPDDAGTESRYRA